MTVALESFVPNLSGRVAIVTGGHAGLGFGTSIELAKNGARVYIASRSAPKVEAVIQAIVAECPNADVHFLRLDLADLTSVVEAAQEFKKHTSFFVLSAELRVLLACSKGESRLFIC
ncbi:short-chain dehydrogenase, putative [Talaromyces stipitatus ATCC 10500]|uniref:Short-chain dehydrogenase, putative n=1 Tax=Talaromyces stipitatus (strain ATCC 10500 / CBS 375.48 / QM 6759 / NRRL 1006) TaxID=441959 RepID=B8M5W5_TALSN|nr:short-chain dehydrogenase, putative [Talaromyces stipitatus ATCC 10500]EED20092.1 short-chain dehydrogenase, putative [Talaromyces stipitatus ATCC 10500]